jgi:hypothetical protein
VNHPAQADEAKGMTDLLPCPFCGWKTPGVCFDGALAWIECPDCFAEGSPCEEDTREKTVAEAIKAWNRRAPALHPDGGNPR